MPAGQGGSAPAKHPKNKTPMPKGMPSWNMRHWETDRPMTFLEALGFSSDKLHFPTLRPQLPSASAGAQHAIPVSGNGGNGGGSNGPTPPRTGSLQQFARKLLAQHSWSTQYTSLNNIIMAESKWNPHIKNRSSGAYGIAQANTHNPQDRGTESDMYGGFGLTHKEAVSANSGNGFWQLVWMLNYIHARYGNPNGAWDFHQSHGWY